MNVRIRIYDPYDIDLIALCDAENFSVPNAMKQALKYYAKKMRLVIEVPDLPDQQLKRDDVKDYRRELYVALDDVNDKEAIDFLNDNIPMGYRNVFMKNLLRSSLESPCLSLCFYKGGADYTKEVIANPRKGRCPVQREIMDHVFLDEGEVGVILSDTNPDVTELPIPKSIKASELKPPTPEENLRKVTENVFSQAEAMKQEEKEKVKKAREELKPTASAKPQKVVAPVIDDDELDDIMTKLMEG